MMANLIAQDASSGNIVAITEPAWQAQDLKIGQLRGGLQQPIDVQPFGPRAGTLKGKRGFGIAIGAGGSQD
jgi:hypothetical protein